jgi:hypothetical protein
LITWSIHCRCALFSRHFLFIYIYIYIYIYKKNFLILNYLLNIFKSFNILIIKIKNKK